MNDSKFPTSQEDQALKTLFERAAATPLDPPAFLATRVVAEIRARAESRRKLRFWRALSVSLAACFALAVAFLPRGARDESLLAQVDKPSVVMVKVQELSGSVASAEIELPDGVYFFSESIPGLKERRELKLAWSESTAKPYLPFVVKSDVAGTKLVKVRFRDPSGGIVQERSIEIHFVRSKS